MTALDHEQPRTPAWCGRLLSRKQQSPGGGVRGRLPLLLLARSDSLRPGLRLAEAAAASWEQSSGSPALTGCAQPGVCPHSVRELNWVKASADIRCVWVILGMIPLFVGTERVDDVERLNSAKLNLRMRDDGIVWNGASGGNFDHRTESVERCGRCWPSICPQARMPTIGTLTLARQ